MKLPIIFSTNGLEMDIQGGVKPMSLYLLRLTGLTFDMYLDSAVLSFARTFLCLL